MTDRVELLRKFNAGPIQPWLVERIHHMEPEGWRMFYDLIEAGAKMPQTFDDTMPRGHDGMISNPYSTPPDKQAAHLQQWADWKEIWGPYPWEAKTVTPRPRFSKWRD